MIDSLTTFINSAGFFAPLYYVLSFVFTALIPIVPTPLVAALGGTAFGIGPAAVYGVMGLGLGAIVSLTLARTVGRPLLHRLVKKEAMEQWEQLLGIRSIVVWGLIFLLTNIDFAVMVSGLSTLPISKLWLAAMVARIPWLLVSVWFGDVILVNDTIALVLLLLMIPGIFLMNRLRPTLQRWLLRIGRLGRGSDGTTHDDSVPKAGVTPAVAAGPNGGPAVRPTPNGSDVSQARIENVADGVTEQVETHN